MKIRNTLTIKQKRISTSKNIPPYIIIQARLGSNRLPKKVVLDFYKGQSILELLISRVKLIVPKDKIIIATSITNEDDSILQIAKKTQVNYYEGSENNVLQRFIQAANYFQAEKIIRLCSDNIFFDLTELKNLYQYVSLSKVKNDYISYDVAGKPSILTPYGLWAEYVNTLALEKINSYTTEKIYREHVTNYIYSYPHKFSIEWLQPLTIPKESIRLTTDTKSDFEYQQEIFAFLMEKVGLSFTTQDILTFLSENRNFIPLMQKEIRNNGK